MKEIKENLHTKESERRCDPAVKPVLKTKVFEGTEKDLVDRFRKRSREFAEEGEEFEEAEFEEPMMGEGAQRMECGNQ